MIPKGKLIAIGGNEDKGKEPEAGHNTKVFTHNFIEEGILRRVVNEVGGAAKRIAVIAIILVYGTSLGIAFSMRHSVLVRISPDRSTLFRKGDDERIYNRFRLNLANRGRTDAAVTISLNGLPDATISMPSNEIAVKAGESIETEFEISVPAGSLPQQVNHFTIDSVAAPEATRDSFEQTFIMPMENKTK